MTRWILVRHGESTANAERWLAGWVDVPLTPKGEAQAAALVSALAGERIPRVFSSDLRRAHDTARGALAGRAYGIRAVPDLRERALGDWTHMADEEVRRTGRRRALVDLRFRPPGGESLLDTARRAMRFLARIDDGEPTLVVAHGGLLRAMWALHRGDVPPAQVGLLPMPNASPLILELPRGRWGELLRSLP